MIKDIDKQYIANTYARFPVELVRGKGSIAYDDEGKEYIDMGSGIAVNCFGYCDDEWQQAIVEQIGTLQHVSNLYYSQPCAKLAKLLCEKSGMKKVFFGNSGAEANECAIKVARKYSADKKGPDCYTIVTIWNSFHGRTLTTLAATGQDHYHELFQPLTPGFVHIHAGDLAALEEINAKTPIAGIMFECVQGEGGVLPLPTEFVQGMAAFAQANDIPLIVDEVQTGNGRTGTFYSYMQFGIQPDIVSTAKGIAGGLPIGACLLGEKVESVLGFGDHGSTFGGNPVSCAAGVSIISRMDEAFLADVRAKGEYLKNTFTGAEGIEDVTGMGLILGLKTVKPAKDIVNACMEKGVLCLTAKDKIRLLPALNIPMDVLQKAAEIIKECCR